MKNIDKIYLILSICCGLAWDGLAYPKPETEVKGHVDKRKSGQNLENTTRDQNVARTANRMIDINLAETNNCTITSNRTDSCNENVTYNASINSTNTTKMTLCKIQLLGESNSFADIISKHKQNGVGLIYFRFKMENQTFSDEIKNDIVDPLTWIWASKKFGTNILLLRENQNFFIHKIIEIGIIEDIVQLKVVPSFCLESYDSHQYTDLILELIFNSTDDTVFMEDGVCTVKPRLEYKEGLFSDNSSSLDFFHLCYGLSSFGNISESEILMNFSITIFSLIHSSFLFISILVIIILLVKKFFFRLLEIKYRIHLLQNEDLHVYVEDVENHFIKEKCDSFKICTWLNRNLYKCRIRENGSENMKDLCNTPLFSTVCEKCTWYLFCSKFVQIIFFCTLCVFPTLILLDYFYNRNVDEIARDAYRSRKGLSTYDSGDYLLRFISPISLICLILVILLQVLLKRYFIIFTNESFSKYNFLELKQIRRISSKCITSFLKKFGIFSIFFFPVMISVATLYFLIELFFYSSSRERYVFRKIDTKTFLTVRFYCMSIFLFVSYTPISLGIMYLILTILINVSIFIIIAVINYGKYLKYLIFTLVSIFYVAQCFRNMAKQYSSFYSYLHKYIRENINIYTLSDFDACFLVVSNKKKLKMSVSKNEYDSKSVCIRIEGAFPLLLNKNKQILLSRRFFFNICTNQMNFKEIPGSPSSVCGSMMCHLLCILFFLFFVFFVINNFGEEYIGSDITQAVAILGSGILPWVIRRNNSTVDELDVTDPEFQHMVEEQISIHHEILPLKTSNNDSNDASDNSTGTSCAPEAGIIELRTLKRKDLDAFPHILVLGEVNDSGGKLSKPSVEGTESQSIIET